MKFENFVNTISKSLVNFDSFDKPTASTKMSPDFLCFKEKWSKKQFSKQSSLN